MNLDEKTKFFRDFGNDYLIKQVTFHNYNYKKQNKKLSK